MSTKRVGIVDADAFYVSCERLFDPTLAGRPVVVLSNNDGCVVSRSREAKALGVGMGAPWFSLAAQAKRHGIIARSSNYELYGDLSARIMEIIGRFTAWQEVYSIDESFIGITGGAEAGSRIREAILRQVGIPCSVGIGRSKSLAKMASKIAKTTQSGVMDFDDYPPERLEQYMEHQPVVNLWGIAARTSQRLSGMGIYTVRQLRDADPHVIRKRFSVVLQRTVYELRGVPCIPLEAPVDRKEQLIFSRSFSEPITTPERMREVMAVYAQQASIRLRRQQSVTSTMNVFASTSYYDPNRPHTASASINFDYPTDNPMRIIAGAAAALAPRINAGCKYVRGGIILTGLTPRSSHAFLEPFQPDFDARNIAPTLDAILRAHGPSSIGLGRSGFRSAPSWSMRRNQLSPRCTTHWGELAMVYAR